jgi:hypothetical protein
MNWNKTWKLHFWMMKLRLYFVMISKKNAQTPVTNVCLEYYLRKFYCFNFGVYDLKSNNVVMFLYPENYAKKGCNETISFINYYINNFISSKVKILNIFSDNYFSQNKNKFLWGFYKYCFFQKIWANNNPLPDSWIFGNGNR